MPIDKDELEAGKNIEAWEKLKGTTNDEAQQQYVDLVAKLGS